MRIAVSADDGRGLDAIVNPHFGRCPYFVLVDVEGSDIRATQTIANPFYEQHQPGQVPAFVHSQGAQVMLTGGMGGRAMGFFDELGIQAVTGASGTVRQAVGRYLRGELQGAAPCRESVEHGHGQAPATGEYEKDEAGRLGEEANLLQQQLNEVMARLKRLQSE